MPVVRSIRTYRRKGRTTYVRLYRAWENLNRRVRGTTAAGNGSNYWQGLPVEWESFEEFREWSLANGYSRERNSLDRIRILEGYGPSNCRWVTRSENTSYQNACRGLTPGDPVNYPDVPF